MPTKIIPNKRTYHSIDLLKVVASLLVVAIHARPFEGEHYPLFISLFSRMAVPVFFVVSAFLFFRKKPGISQLLHYLKRMALLYAFWLVVESYMVVESYFLLHDWSLGKAIAILVRNFFLNSTFSGSWFIMALMLGVPFVYALSRKLSTGCIVGIGVAIYGVVTVASNYYHYLPPAMQHSVDDAYKLLGLFHNSVLPAIAFCGIGKLIAEQEARIARWHRGVISVVLLLCVALSAIEVSNHQAYFDDCYFMLLLTIPTLMIWVLRHEVQWQLPYSFMRNFSTITYFSHFIFVWLLAEQTALSPMGRYFVIVVLCLLTTIVLRYLARHIPWLAYAF
ncbi:MAG: acyltransferase family protein [Sodaliphilus sp.]